MAWALFLLNSCFNSLLFLFCIRDKILLLLPQSPLHEKMHSDRSGSTELTRISMIPCNNWSAFPSERHKAWIMQYQPLCDWQEPGPWAPTAWNNPHIKTSFNFYFLDYTVTGDLEIYTLLGIWKINCFQTLLQCLCNSLRTGRDLASCATSHRSCILELALLWNNWNFLQAEVCTQSSVFPCKHTTAPLSFNYQKPAPTIYQAWHSIRLCS